MMHLRRKQVRKEADLDSSAEQGSPRTLMLCGQDWQPVQSS